MEVGRNDACPCGSGKKYKKCCMKKAEVIKIGEVRLEQFFRRKHQLTERLNSEIFQSYSYSEINTLKREFKQRVNEEVPDNFFDQWLFFCYRDHRGMRGIELYNKEASGKREEPALKELADNWEKLVPRLVQQVDFDDRGVIVEDIMTKERFHMPYCETMPEWTPWAGSIIFMEEFDGGYYLNGVAFFAKPVNVIKAYQFLQDYQQETGSSYEEAVIAKYPEILGILLSKRVLSHELTDVVQTTLRYEVSNIANVAEACNKNSRFSMDEWNGSRGKGSFVKDMYRYTDNAISGYIQLSEVEGTMNVNGDKITYTTFQPQAASAFKALMNEVEGAKLVDEKIETLATRAGQQTNLYGVHLDKAMPSYFAAIAQQGLLMQATDKPLPLFSGLTPEEMAARSKTEELENWLQELEFGSYINMKNTAEEVKVTADFNTVRRKLGLKPSPFVTLGEKRQSEVSLIANYQFDSQDAAENEEAPLQSSFEKKDLALLEEIGLPLEEQAKFYAQDMAAFFKEKGAGKSQNTYYKYRLGLQTISSYFGGVSASSWSEVQESDWQELIALEYLAFNQDASENQAKGFFTVIKSLAAWIDDVYGTKHAPVVRSLEKELKQSIFAAVHVLETYVPYYQRRHESGFNLTHIKQLFAENAKDSAVEGIFKIVEIKEEEVRLEVLSESGKTYNAAVVPDAMPAIEHGMIIIGSIVKEKDWRLFDIKRVFPAQAERFLIKENVFV